MAKKRGNGEGWLGRKIVKGKNGKEYIYWTAQVTTGEGKTRQITGKSQDEVRVQMTKLTRDRDRGLGVAADRQTVAAYLTSWLDTKRATGTSESAVMRYESDIRLHIIPALGKITLQKLTAQRVQAFYAAKLGTGTHSSTSILHMHNVLRNALNDAVRLDLIPRNVTALTNKPKRAEYHAVFYTPDQVEALFAAAEDHPLHALVVLVTTTGMRLGELLALRWRDVDLACDALTVRQTRTKTRAGMADGKPKTDAGHRRIDLTEETVEALRAHRKQQLAARLRVGDAWHDEDRVFCGRTGAALHGSVVLRQFNRLQHDANLPETHIHELRHTAASLMIAEGAPLADVSRMLGHASIDVTGRIYGHLMPHAGRAAKEAMDRSRRRGSGQPNERRKDGHE